MSPHRPHIPHERGNDQSIVHIIYYYCCAKFLENMEKRRGCACMMVTDGSLYRICGLSVAFLLQRKSFLIVIVSSSNSTTSSSSTYQITNSNTNSCDGSSSLVREW